MKDNFSTMVLTGVLLVFVLASVGLSYLFVSMMGRTQALQVRMEQVNQNVARMNGLAAEARVYGEKNPAIKRILDDAGVKPAGN